MLQGDVGSARQWCRGSHADGNIGWQAGSAHGATEILAEQHYQSITHLLDNAQEWGLHALCLSCCSPECGRKERQEIYAAIASGEADIVIGTTPLSRKA